MKKAATKAEREHMDKVQALNCIVCRNQGYPDSPCEIHHPRSGVGMGQRSSHYAVIGLCPTHHRLGGIGTALHAGQKTFEAKYGTEEELLEQVRELLGESHE